MIREFLNGWIDEILTEMDEFNYGLLKGHVSPKHELTETRCPDVKTNFCEHESCEIKQYLLDKISDASSKSELLHLESHLNDALQEVKRIKRQKFSNM